MLFAPVARASMGSSSTSDPIDRESRSLRGGAAGWLSWIVGIAILVAVIVAVLHSSEERELLRLARGARPWWMLVALVLQAATYFFQGEVWRVVKEHHCT